MARKKNPILANEQAKRISTEYVEIAGVKVQKRRYAHSKGNYTMYLRGGRGLGYTADETRRTIIKMKMNNGGKMPPTEISEKQRKARRENIKKARAAKKKRR